MPPTPVLCQMLLLLPAIVIYNGGMELNHQLKVQPSIPLYSNHLRASHQAALRSQTDLSTALLTFLRGGKNMTINQLQVISGHKHSNKY